MSWIIVLNEEFFLNFLINFDNSPRSFVDLEKCCKMSIWLQKSALIQPRTSLRKLIRRRRDRRGRAIGPLCPRGTKQDFAGARRGGALGPGRAATAHAPLRRLVEKLPSSL